MRLKKFGLFRFKLHESWILVFCLLMWSLERFIATYYSFHDSKSLLIWGIFGSVALIVSILIHETGHIFSAFFLKENPISNISILPFGGVAYFSNNLPNKNHGIIISLSGPLANILLALIFYEISKIGIRLSWPKLLLLQFDCLISINILLAGINLLPIQPLDCGFILRTCLENLIKSSEKALKISADIGNFSSWSMIIGGIILIYRGFFDCGIWLFLGGLILRDSNKIFDNRSLIKQGLEGEYVSDYMRRNPIIVHSSINIEQFVYDYIYKYNISFFPVSSSGQLIGHIDSSIIKEIPESRWLTFSVKDLTVPLSENQLSTNSDVIEALALMCRKNESKLLVMDKDQLAGIITLKDLQKFFAGKIHLDNLSESIPKQKICEPIQLGI